jgi:diamine N-acetyltransferase
MVGFTMLFYVSAEHSDYGDEPFYYICRFMIDKKYQNQGFGRQAMIKILEYIKTFPQGEVPAIYLSYNPNNDVARKLYKSFGFVETGEIDDGEVVAKLTL